MGAVIPAFLLGAAALFVIFFIAGSLLAPLFGKLRRMESPVPGKVGSPASFLFARTLNKKVKILNRVDEAIKNGAFEQALELLKNAFFLEHIKSDRNAVNLVYRHNLQTLNKAVGLLRERSAHIENLAVIEELFLNRNELMEAYLEAIEARRNIRRKREQKGKKTPAWGTEELAKKAKSIREKIFTNKYSLKSQLAKMFTEAKGLANEQEITYH